MSRISRKSAIACAFSEINFCFKFPMIRFPVLVLMGSLIGAAPVFSQTLIFQAGAVELSEVNVSGANVQRKNGQGRPIPLAAIVRVDFPEPEELADADGLMLKAKYPEALEKAKVVQELHRHWKDKPGSWYPQASLLVAESLIRQNKIEETSRLMSELRNMTLSSGLQIRVAMLDALEQYQKGITGPAYTKVKALIPGAKDAETLARLYLLAGDIQFKRGAFAEALDAYLQIPVFYGAEAAFLPAADLGAAKCLVRLNRLQDASDSLTRIVERYAGTPEADAAKAEKAEVAKLTGGSS